MNHSLHLIVDIGLDMTSFNIFLQKSENWEKCNRPDLLDAFPKKWWIESVFAAPNLPLPLRLKDSGCHYNSIFCNTGIVDIGLDMTSFNISFEIKLCKKMTV
jgi:hypothetical protein